MTLEGVRLTFRLGDTWLSQAWAVLIDDEPVDLSINGWVVRCQARRRSQDPAVQEWSTENGRILLGLASVQYGDTGAVGETSTIQLRHSAAESDAWDPFSAEFEIEIERGVEPEVERYTIVSGRVTGLQDVTDQ